MKKNLLTWGVLLLLVINVATFATFAYKRWQAQQTIKKMYPHRRPLRFLQRRLNLSPDQLEQFRALTQQFEQETKPLVDSIQQKELVLHNELLKDSPDSNRINHLIDEIGLLQTTFKKKAFYYIQKKKAILTPVQQHKFMDFILKQQHHRKPMRRRNW